jgi:hypothetical protein
MPILPQAVCQVVTINGPVCTGTLLVKVPTELCPGQEANSCNANVQLPTQTGSYSIYIKSNNGANKTSSISFTVGVSTKIVPVKNVIIAGTVYRIGSDGYKYPYTSAGAFLSYSYDKFSDVTPATSTEQALPNASTFVAPRDGSLINDNGTIYLVTNGNRVGFANFAAFQGMGYSLNNVLPGDTSFLQTLAPITSANVTHPDGTVILNNGTAYLVKNGARFGIPSMSVLSSWGYNLSETVQANSQDQQIPDAGVLQGNSGV